MQENVKRLKLPLYFNKFYKPSRLCLSPEVSPSLQMLPMMVTKYATRSFGAITLLVIDRSMINRSIIQSVSESIKKKQINKLDGQIK